MPSCCREVYAPGKARPKSVVANGIALFLEISYDDRMMGLFAAVRLGLPFDRGQRSLLSIIACSPGKNAEQSFGLQAKLNRRGRNLARCCRVVLEDLKRLAERCCRELSLTKHNSRAHKASPALDVSRRAL